jgi:hypothetical protein
VEKTFCPSGCDAAMTMPAFHADPMAQLVTDTAAAKSLLLDAFKFRARVAAGAANKRN